MYLVRYQAVIYHDHFGRPISPQITFEGPNLHWLPMGENIYLAVSICEIPLTDRVSAKQVELLQDPLDYANDVLTVKNGCIGMLESPDPIGVLLFAGSEAELKSATNTIIEKPKGRAPLFGVMHCSLREMEAAYLTRERLNFLAPCERRGLGRGNLIDDMRLFEAAFAISGDKLRKRLIEFLSSDNCSYSSDEVRLWQALRGALAHGDRKKNWAHETRSWQVMPRVRQAAFDVTFNKEVWASSSTMRTNRAPIRTQITPEFNVIATKGFEGQVMPFMLDSFKLSFVNKNWSRSVGSDNSTSSLVVNAIKAQFDHAELIRFRVEAQRQLL